MQIHVTAALIFAVGVFIAADFNVLSGLKAFFIFIGLFGNLALNKPCFDGFDHAAHLLNLLHLLEDFFFHLQCQGFNEIRSCQGIHGVAQADLLHEDFKCSQGEQGRPGCGDGVGLVKRAQRRGLGTGQRRPQGIEGSPHDVVLGLFLGQPAAAPAEEAPQEELFFLRDTVVIFQHPGPEFTGRSEFGYLFPQVSIDVEIEGKTAHEIFSPQSAFHDIFHVSLGNLKCAADFLGRCRARFPDVITAQAYRVAARQLFDGVLDGVTDQADAMLNRINPGAAADHLLQDVVLRGGGYLLFRVAEFFRHGLVHGQHDGRHRIDGQPGADAVQGDILKCDFKIS